MMPYIALADLCDNVTMCHNVTRLLNSLVNSVVLKYYRRTDSEKYFRSRLLVPHWLKINGAKEANMLSSAVYVEKSSHKLVIESIFTEYILNR